MQQSPSWEANNSSASQEIPRILWNPKVHYRINKSSPPVPILSQRSIQSVSPSLSSRLYFNIILPFTPGSCKWSSSLRFSLNPYMHLSCSPYVLHALPISVFLIWSSEWYLVRNTEHKAPPYAVFSTPLLSHPSWAQISSSASYSWKLSAYIPPSVWATKFYTHTQEPARL